MLLFINPLIPLLLIPFSLVVVPSSDSDDIYADEVEPVFQFAGTEVKVIKTKQGGDAKAEIANIGR